MRSRSNGAARLAALVAVFLFAGAPAVAGGEDSGNAGSRWGASYFPNVPLVTHEGKTVHFFDDLIKDKVVVINFIYTSCPDSCPLETARLAEVQNLLGDRVGKDVFMYSISIDPETDTPEVLAKYRQSYHAREGWTFLTGKAEDIVLLRKKLGLYLRDLQSESDHNLSLIIGNQAMGRWRKSSPYENPYVLAENIGNWLTNYKLPRKEKRDFADAPKLRNISDGENLFRTRCAVCHTVGRAKDRLVRVGPDLFDVTGRRDREWLERWLREPDKMLAEGDELANQLFEAYYRIPMPNMRLSSEDIDDVLEYLESETERIAQTENVARKSIEEAMKRQDHSAPCCQKKQQLVLGLDEAEEPEKEAPEPLLSKLSLVSIGMGCVLGLVAFLFRKRQ